MWGYGYIHCDKCGRRLKIRLGQRSRVCPYCGKKVEVIGTKVERVKD
jgi:predicted RNA-binding Zn-ribbon protein involved in translation (DUF1610 family)